MSATQLANKPTLIVDHSWSVGPTGPLEQHFTHRGEFAAFVALAKAGAIVDEHYRKRTVLGVRVLPEDIAQAVMHFASSARSGKSTGNLLNVDGGVIAAFPR